MIKHPDKQHGVVPRVPSARDSLDPSRRLEQRVAGSGKDIKQRKENAESIVSHVCKTCGRVRRFKKTREKDTAVHNANERDVNTRWRAR